MAQPQIPKHRGVISNPISSGTLYSVRLERSGATGIDMMAIGNEFELNF